MPSPQQNEVLLIDDRRGGDRRATSGNEWRLVTDSVMGGVSQARLDTPPDDSGTALQLRGRVSLENNGGFVQMTLDLAERIRQQAPVYEGVFIEVRGNAQTYNIHLRTTDISLPWQSYRVSFQAPLHWQRLHFPFDDFIPHRTQRPFNPARLQRFALVAIGREYEADIGLRALGLYRASSQAHPE